MALGERLRKAMDFLQKSSLDKEAVKNAVKEIQRALISSDIEVKTVQKISKEIEEEAFKEPKKGLSKREHVVKTTYDLLVEMLGGKEKVPEKPKKILLVGLFGAGKTTATAKLAKYYQKRGMKVGVVCADTFRPAAFEQLKQLSEKIEADFYGDKKEKKAEKIVENALKKLKKTDLIIVDSAGRNALEKELEKEIKAVEKAFKPEQTWLVIGADIGQLAKKQAKAFHESVGVNGVIITRMDGSAKGGGAITACNETKAKVYFIGTGEKPEDLQEFDADRFLSRIMGYGDLQSLLEKAKEIEDIEINPEELLKGEFNMKMFYEQLKATKKLGPLGKVMEMIGISSQMPKDLVEVSEQKLEGFKTAMDSMTQKEMKEPELLNRSRIQRIAKGSGKKEEDVRELIKQYKRMKSVFKKFKKLGELDEKSLKSGKIQKLLQSFGKKKKMKIR